MRNNDDRGGNPFLKCTFETADNSVFYQNLTMCQKGMFDRTIKRNVCVFM